MRITKQQSNALAELQRELRLSRSAVALRFKHLLVLLSEATDTYNVLARDHNHHLQRARDFVEAVAAELRDAFDEKSERWKESEAGNAAEAMVEEWENARIEDIELVSVVEPDPPHFEESLNLPEEDQ